MKQKSKKKLFVNQALKQHNKLVDAANAIVGHDHEKQFNVLKKTLTLLKRKWYNEVIQHSSQPLHPSSSTKYIEAAKEQGNYYDETAVEANRTNEQRIADDIKAQTGKDVTVTKDESKERSS